MRTGSLDFAWDDAASIHAREARTSSSPSRLHSLGVHRGDLLVVELRTRGRAATGELVIVKAGNNVYVGRWWQKHGHKALMADGLAEIATGKSRRNLKVVAAINQIVRL